MIQYLCLLLLSTSEYGPSQAHQDSLFLYNSYKESAKMLENTTKPGQVYMVDDKLAQATAAALLRLSTFNNQTYEAEKEYNKEGVGVAFDYPRPSAFIESVPKVSPNMLSQPKQPDRQAYAAKLSAPSTDPHETRPIAFKVLDNQTHFIVKNGKTTTPYVLMNYYAKGRILVKTEKLNPVTFEPIQSEDENSVASSE
jgi:hypothetical protein